MAGIHSVENGKKGGRPTGRKNNKTIEREAAFKAYQQMVLEQIAPLFRKQLWLAMGKTYVYRKEKHGTGASMRIEHVLLENPHEIADALDTIANHDAQDDEAEGFVYITTTPPDNSAIKDMLDRSIGKPTQKIGGDADNPLEIVTITKYAHGGTATP